MLNHSRSGRRLAVTTMVLCSIVTLVTGFGPIRSAPAAALVQSCRLHTDLAMRGDILSDAFARKFGNGPGALYIVTLILDNNRHLMFCGFDFYCSGNGDKCALREDLSSNISSVEPNAGGGPCPMIWNITPVNDSIDTVFGFKLKYEEDYITSGGIFKPRKKNAKLRLHFPANYVEGSSINVLDTVVEQSDGEGG